MKINVARFRPLVLAFLCLVNFPVAPSRAQEGSIPDPGLNAALRLALQKQSGPLTEQDLMVGYIGNPLIALVLPEPLAITNLGGG